MNDRLKGLLSFLILFVLAAIISQYLRLVDSEIWSFYVSRNSDLSGQTLTGFYWKPLANLLLRVVSSLLLPFGDEAYFRAGRFLWALLFAAQCFLFHRISKRWGFSERTQVIGLALLLSARYYLTESLRVRADHLAMIFLLLFIETLLILRKEKPVNQEKWGWSGGILLFLAVASTPKHLPQALLLLVISTYFLKLRRPVVLRMMGSFVGLIALSIFMFIRVSHNHSLIASVGHSWSESLRAHIFNSENQVFLWDQLFFLFPLWGLSAWGFARALRSWFDGKKIRKDSVRLSFLISTFALLNAIFVFLHPEPHPWYTATTIPFLVLAAMTLIEEVSPSYERYLTPNNVGIVSSLLIGFTLMNIFVGFKGFTQQMRVLNDLDQYASRLKITSYFDSTGLLMRRQHSLPFLTVGHEQDFEQAEKSFHREPPELFIRTGRSSMILPQLAADLDSKFLNVDFYLGLWVRRDFGLAGIVGKDQKISWIVGPQWARDIRKEEILRIVIPGASAGDEKCEVSGPNSCIPKTPHWTIGTQVYLLPDYSITGETEKYGSLDSLFSPSLGYF
jgi:hypothetical protein